MPNKFCNYKPLITFKDLGFGRLGNQMFQYAALKGIAAYNNFDYAVPPPREDITLYKCFKNTLKYSKELPEFETVFPKGFEFDEEMLINCPPNKNILHYFQTEKYFKHIKEKIKYDFSFDEFIVSTCKTYIEELYPDTDIISLHVRRTDYITDENLYPLPFDYYKESLKFFDNNLPVFVISDDYKWCEEQEFFSDKRFKIIKSKNPFVDLCMMSLCQYHIIANSSFGWWGAWLSESKQVISPKKWFRQDGTWGTKDLYCSDWIQL